MKLLLITLISACIVGFGSCRFVHYGNTRCLNVWDEGCNNGGIPGSGKDEDFLHGGGNPGKRCANLWDEGCNNGGIPGSGKDEDFLNGGGNPGKRCANLWDEGCNNGEIPGSGKDEDFLNGGGSPGKRSLDLENLKKLMILQYLRAKAHN